MYNSHQLLNTDEITIIGKIKNKQYFIVVKNPHYKPQFLVNK